MSELVQEVYESDYIDGKTIRITKIKEVLQIYNELIKTNNVIVVLDIDDVVFSSKYYKVFTDDHICKLATYVYNLKPKNLIFLTSRLKTTQNYTQEQLNHHKLIKSSSDNPIKFNIIFAECDQSGKSTKGPNLISYLQKNNLVKTKTWIIFIDDLIENINSVKNSLDQLNLTNQTNQTNQTNPTNISYTLFHYKN